MVILKVILYIFLTIKSYGLLVEPPIFNVDLSVDEAREVYLYNDSREAKRYLIDIADDVRYEDYSITENIKVFPRIVSLMPGDGKSIRMRVKKGEGLENGEYKSYIKIEELPAKVSRNKDIDARMKIVTWLSVYGVYGEIDRKTLVKHRIEGDTIISEVINKGNSGARMLATVEIKDRDRNVRSEEISIVRIMRDEEKEVISQIELEDGEKISKVSYYRYKEDE